MFSISTKGLYGFAALFELAIAHGKDCVQVREIARAQRVPEDYLRQLLLTLKKAGLVKSIRGAAGGYKLTRHPSEITVREIFETLGGSIRLAKDDLVDDVLCTYLGERELEIRKLFDQCLEDLVMEKQKAKKNIVYYI
jgi:Rrf2 family protein